MKRKTFDQIILEVTSCPNYTNWQDMPFGVKRREMILEFLEKVGAICINRRWCANLKYDSDIRYLLKKNLVLVGRYGAGGRTRTSYIALNRAR